MYEIFKKLMEEKGLTAYKVSTDTGISQATLSDWKNGKISSPKMDKLVVLAKYFDVDLDYLMGNTSIRRKLPVLNTQESPVDEYVIGDVVIELNKAKRLSMSAKECLDLFENASPEVRDFVLQILRKSSQLPSLRQ